VKQVERPDVNRPAGKIDPCGRRSLYNHEEMLTVV
jgi:hypothetical protein